MSTLDDAIAAHMAHGAASGFDPLTDSLAEQQDMQTPALRAGWETEPTEVHFPRWLALAAITAGIVLSMLLTGCGGGGDDEEDAEQPRPSVDCKATPEKCL